MNINLNNLLKLSHLLSKSNIGYTPRRKKRNRKARLLNKKPVNMSSAVQSLGPGSTLLRVNDIWNVTNGTDYKDILSTALGGEEFLSRKINYKYMKIIGLKLTVFPFNSTTNTMIYLNFEYGPSGAIGSNNIMNDDRSKVIASYIVKPTTFRFVPPNVTFTTLVDLGLGMMISRSYNYKEWLSVTDAGYLRSGLNVYNSGSTAVTIQTEFIFAFRGSTFDVNANKMLSLFIKLDKEKQQEIIKAVRRDISKEEDKKEEEEEEEVEENKDMLKDALKIQKKKKSNK